jgi:N-acyl-D-aspartate/D-glutamate deacylase
MGHVGQPKDHLGQTPQALLAVVEELAESLAVVSAQLRHQMLVRPSLEADLRSELEATRAELARLRESLGSRALIEQAKGMLMPVAGTDAEGAFALLLETSRMKRRKVRDLALELVSAAERGLTPVTDFVAGVQSTAGSGPSLRCVEGEKSTLESLPSEGARAPAASRRRLHG